jgi:hypothetical protein
MGFMNVLGMGAMNVTNYLRRARECAELAERANAQDKLKLLEIADAWLMLADHAAKAASASPLAPTSLDGASSLDGKVR